MWLGHRFQGQSQLVADVLNSQHVGIGATWQINTKILSTCRGGGISWRPPAYSLLWYICSHFLNKLLWITSLATVGFTEVCGLDSSYRSFIVVFLSTCWLWHQRADERLGNIPPSTSKGSWLVKTGMEDLEVSSGWANTWSVINSPFSGLILFMGKRRVIRPVKVGCWCVDGDNLTGALHVL